MMNMPQNAISIALLGQVAQPLVIMSCALGKTSFIITLLRIGSQRWVKFLLWFILVTMNILHIFVAILLFFRCEDPRVLWDTAIETTCWPVDVYLHIMNFIGGGWPFPSRLMFSDLVQRIRRPRTLCSLSSLGWSFGIST